MKYWQKEAVVLCLAECFPPTLSGSRTSRLLAWAHDAYGEILFLNLVSAIILQGS
jgi:hypothetical protein